jgi:Ca-activated chloride channel family protein
MPSSGFDPDARQDAELRGVPVPDGLMERLRRAALADNEGLNAAICNVPVPPGLFGWLRQPALYTDEGLDAALRYVPFPAELSARLRQVPKGFLRFAGLTRWAAAASLVVAIGLSYFGAMIGFLLAVYPYSAELFPSKSVLSFRAGYVGQLGQPDADFSVAAAPGGNQTQQDRSDGLPAPVPEIGLVNLDNPARSALADSRDLIGGPAGADLLLDVALHRWGVLSAHRQFDELPELKLVSGLIPRGIDWPLVPGSNPHILLRYGIHPFVSPASHPQLQSGLVPLDVDAASYQLTHRYLEDGRLPPPDAVRTEEFLAAVDYEFPPPTREALELSTAAGPSPFGSPGLWLMQVGVQARQLQADQHPPMRLVLVVDVSASMRWGGRLEMIRKELSSLVPRLGPQDRVSLITFSENARVLAEEAGPDEAKQLLAVIGVLSAQSSTNVGVGLHKAYMLAGRGVALRQIPTRVVLLTDGLAEFGPGTAEKIEQQLADAAGRGILLHVIDLGQEKVTHPQLSSFARSGGGKVHQATSGKQLRWALLEIITGRPQLIASDARLKVAFDPKAVLEYRLLGHEAKAMAGLMPAHPEADFHAGQSATALYEMRLDPNGPQDVATVELSWREPGQDKSHLLRRSVRRRDFGSVLAEAPLSLQEAALVAETAEVLRRSPYAVSPSDPPSAGLTLVRQLAGRVDKRLYRRPSFVEFLSLVEQAEKAKPFRGR